MLPNRLLLPKAYIVVKATVFLLYFCVILLSTGFVLFFLITAQSEGLNQKTGLSVRISADAKETNGQTLQ